MSMAILSISCTLLFLFAIKAYHVATSPLSRLPGPYLSKWTNLKLKFATLSGERVRYVHEMHERYGSVVRISPTEVSLADVSAIRAVYKTGSPYIKSEWYKAFVGDPKTFSLFAHSNRKEHADIRKIIAANFTERWIKNLEPYVAKNVRLAISRMADEAKEKGYCDVFKWFMFMASDVIGEAAFGESFKTLETGKKNQYIEDVGKAGEQGIVRSEFFGIMRLLPYLPIPAIKQAKQGFLRTTAYGQQSVQRYWTQLRADPENVKPTLLTKEFAAVEAGLLSVAQLNRDATGYIVAGTDTTAITATYAVWLLSKHPQIEQDVIREVGAVPSEFNDEHLRQLPILHGVLREVLRLRPALSQCLPRIVPPGGAEFGGFYIPGGATVGIQAWTMHRDPHVWMDPEAFMPSRWEHPTREMKDCFLTFGGGSRVCIGSHFAQLELRHALANFYRTFESGVKPSWTEGFSEDDMVPRSLFLNAPKGGRCLMARRK